MVNSSSIQMTAFIRIGKMTPRARKTLFPVLAINTYTDKQNESLNYQKQARFIIINKNAQCVRLITFGPTSKVAGGES